VVVDANGDMDEVAEAIRVALRAYLPVPAAAVMDDPAPRHIPASPATIGMLVVAAGSLLAGVTALGCQLVEAL
jgi:hypothetical protein